MKVILLFALFGLSSYQASGNEGGNGTDNEGGNKGYPAPSQPESKEHTCKTSKVSYGDAKDCLARALRESATLKKDAGVFLCEYQTLEKGGNAENFEETAKSFMHSVGCSRCELEGILGKGHSIDDVLTEISEAKVKVGGLLEKLVSALEISGIVADTLCSQKAAPKAKRHMRDIHCQVNTDKAEMAGNLIDSLEDHLESLDDAVKPVAGRVMDLTKRPVGIGSLCKVIGSFGKGGVLERILEGILRDLLKDKRGIVAGFPSNLLNRK